MAETAKTLTSPLSVLSPTGASHWENLLEATGQGSLCDAVYRSPEQSGNVEHRWGGGVANTDDPAASLSHRLEGGHAGQQPDQ